MQFFRPGQVSFTNRHNSVYGYTACPRQLYVLAKQPCRIVDIDKSIYELVTATGVATYSRTYHSWQLYYSMSYSVHSSLNFLSS